MSQSAPPPIAEGLTPLTEPPPHRDTERNAAEAFGLRPELERKVLLLVRRTAERWPNKARPERGWKWRLFSVLGGRSSPSMAVGRSFALDNLF